MDIQTYGQPSTRETSRFVQKFYDSWAGVIKMMSEKMPNVQVLNVLIDVQEWPLLFTFRERWVAPLLEFRAFQRLRDVKIEVHTPNLRTIKEGVGTLLAQEAAQMNPSLSCVIALHHLFSKAISRRVMGYCESCSVERFRAFVMDPEGELYPVLSDRAMQAPTFLQALDWSWVND